MHAVPPDTESIAAGRQLGHDYYRLSRLEPQRYGMRLSYVDADFRK